MDKYFSFGDSFSTDEKEFAGLQFLKEQRVTE